MVQWSSPTVNERMQSIQLVLEILIYGFALWLGLYLIGRDLTDTRLRFAGAGLVAYAVGLGLDTLIAHSPDPDLVFRLDAWQRLILFLPAVFWLGLLWRLVPRDMTLRAQLQRQPRPLAVVMAATIFFGLGVGFMFLSLDWPPRFWLLAAIGIDLLLLGLAVAVLDAFAEGQTLLPHLLRSFVSASLTALLFGGQVVLVMALSTGVTSPMLVLLLSTIAVAILFQTFSEPFQAALDGLAFFKFPRIRQARTALQTAASVASRVNSSMELESLDDEEFTRLTRRALSNLGNLPKLAASPLTRLSLVETRLNQNGQETGTLERANALKAILSESINRLKPPGQGEFGTAEAWRHFNALYYPYVLGLKPYRRRFPNRPGDDSLRHASEWFRNEVPQRTLYNWQNAAARLVAQDLRERSKKPA